MIPLNENVRGTTDMVLGNSRQSFVDYIHLKKPACLYFIHLLAIAQEFVCKARSIAVKKKMWGKLHTAERHFNMKFPSAPGPREHYNLILIEGMCPAVRRRYTYRLGWWRSLIIKFGLNRIKCNCMIEWQTLFTKFWISTSNRLKKIYSSNG